MPRMDLASQRFGRLTVLEEADPGYSRGGTPYRRWRCRCDCGNEIVVRQSALRNGNTKSCGCLRRELASAIQIDLTGQRFGRLTVLDEAKPVHSSGNLLRCWRCRCDCGNELIVRQSSLRNGNTKSCGCLQRDMAAGGTRTDLPGRRFGRLTVLDEAEPVSISGTSYRRWRCRCDCGNEIVVRQSSLTGGQTRSCGCLMRDTKAAVRMDLTGQRFGRLTVLDEAEPGCKPSGKTYRRWRCRCDCGNEAIVRQTQLTTGRTRSCGCLQRAIAAKRARKGGELGCDGGDGVDT